MNKILSVSIVLFNTSKIDLINCLESLKKVSIPFDLFLIDNSLQDQLKDIVIIYPNTFYIHLPDNPGYGSGHNVAIERSSASDYLFHLVINADVFFNSDVLTPMIKYMMQNDEVAQMMPKVLNADGSIQRLCRLLPTPFDFFIRRFVSYRIRDRFNRKIELHFSGYDKKMFVPFLSGCFMLLRHSSLKYIGNFDPRFFMYAEDIDLTRRLAEKYETIYFPDVFIYHLHGEASKKSFKMFAIHFISIVKYFNKWGWFFDSKRDQLNKKTLLQFNFFNS
jgi:GT2 family glycosyltransferase